MGGPTLLSRPCWWGARIQHVQIQALINNFMQVYVNMQQKSKKVRVTLNWFPDLTSKGETCERPPAGKGCWITMDLQLHSCCQCWRGKEMAHHWPTRFRILLMGGKYFATIGLWMQLCGGRSNFEIWSNNCDWPISENKVCEIEMLW